MTPDKDGDPLAADDQSPDHALASSIGVDVSDPLEIPDPTTYCAKSNAESEVKCTCHEQHKDPRGCFYYDFYSPREIETDPVPSVDGRDVNQHAGLGVC